MKTIAVSSECKWNFFEKEENRILHEPADEGKITHMLISFICNIMIYTNACAHIFQTSKKKIYNNLPCNELAADAPLCCSEYKCSM